MSRPRAGASAIVRDVRGTVFVKLPARGAKQAAEFVPLKGVASLPMGTTVDARKGSLTMVDRRQQPPASTTGGAARRTRGSRPGSSASARPVRGVP